MSVHIAANELN